jgi:transposase, IS5 family
MHAAIKGPSRLGHLKAEGHLGRCHLKRRAGGAANSMLSAAGCNFRRILS